MSQIKTPSEILLIAKIGQPLSFVDIANQEFLKGGAINSRLPIMIAAERLCVQWDYDTNPTDSTLRETSTYLYQLLGKYANQAENILNNLAQSPPVVTGPSNQSVNVGQQATFTIVVTSTLPYTIQWYQNGIPIIGQTGLTYSVTPDGTYYNGTTYAAIVTNAAGQTPSANAILTVTDIITGSLYIGQTNYYSELVAGNDDINYTSGFEITHNQPITVPLPFSASQNNYQVYKIPITESIKTLWRNTVSDGGNIPGFVFYPPVTIGAFRYYVTSEQILLDINSPMTLT